MYVRDRNNHWPILRIYILKYRVIFIISVNEFYISKASRGLAEATRMHRKKRTNQYKIIYHTIDLLVSGLTSILLKQTFISGGTECIQIGDSIVEYNKNFR